MPECAGIFQLLCGKSLDGENTKKNPESPIILDNFLLLISFSYYLREEKTKFDRIDLFDLLLLRLERIRILFSFVLLFKADSTMNNKAYGISSIFS